MDKEFGSRIEWKQGLPSNPFEYFKDNEIGLCIIDDLMSDIQGQSKDVSDWFTKGSHHENISIVVLVQNLFPHNMRTISLNAHIVVLFNNPRDQSQLTRFLIQPYPGYGAVIRQGIHKFIYTIPHRPVIFNFLPKTDPEYSITCV